MSIAVAMVPDNFWPKLTNTQVWERGAHQTDPTSSSEALSSRLGVGKYVRWLGFSILGEAAVGECGTYVPATVLGALEQIWLRGISSSGIAKHKAASWARTANNDALKKNRMTKFRSYISTSNGNRKK